MRTRSRAMQGAVAMAALAGALGATALLVRPATAGLEPIDATIMACYKSTACGFTAGALDAPAFQFTNKSAFPIDQAEFLVRRNAKAGVVQDKFSIGTIAVGASVVVIPGLSDDGKTHPAGGMFTFLGHPLDTSKFGPLGNRVQFGFAGRSPGVKLIATTIVVRATAGTSNDGSVAEINFLGGPKKGEAGTCGNCFGPLLIGNIVPVRGPAPELTSGLR